MSDARKKLQEEYVKDIAKLRREQRTMKKQAGGVDEQYFAAEDNITMLKEDLASVRGKEEKTKEEIKRKKEELRLKREENLVKFRNGVRHMIDDEKSGIIHYEELIVKADPLRYTEPRNPIIFELKKILDEERRHLNTLKEMMNWK